MEISQVGPWRIILLNYMCVDTFSSACILYFKPQLLALMDIGQAGPSCNILNRHDDSCWYSLKLRQAARTYIPGDHTPTSNAARGYTDTTYTPTPLHHRR